MRRSVLAVAGALAPVCLLGCSLALSFDGLDDGTPDASTGDATPLPPPGNDGGDAADRTQPPADGAADALDTGVGPPDDASASPDATTDGASDAPVDSGADAMLDAPTDAPGDSPADAPPDVGDAAPEAACSGGTGGPAMVPVTSFCIDSTEVTVGQYKVFLAAKSGDVTGQPAKCQWNASYVPNFWPPSGPDTQALRGVDWCDAYMFCEWAGKRLCGNPNGGPANVNTWADPAQSEWYRACSHNNDGLHVYPYGLNYDPKACNGKDYDAGGPLPSLATCEGAYPGLFDMSGNVIEWEDSCQPAALDASDQTGASDYCNIRGGGFGQDQAGVRCDEGYSTLRGNGGGDNGFRCCSK